MGKGKRGVREALSATWSLVLVLVLALILFIFLFLSAAADSFSISYTTTSSSDSKTPVKSPSTKQFDAVEPIVRFLDDVESILRIAVQHSLKSLREIVFEGPLTYVEP